MQNYNFAQFYPKIICSNKFFLGNFRLRVVTCLKKLLLHK